MQVFEVVPALSIATRLDTSSEYGTLDVDVIVDLEDWEAAWAPPVPLGRLYVSFPMDDGDEVDPKVRELAVFIASLVTSGRRVLVHCTEGLNRSGIVVARALMEMGLTASDAIDLVRRQRGPSVDGFPALGNDAFVDWLHREGPPGLAVRFPGSTPGGLEMGSGGLKHHRPSMLTGRGCRVDVS
jgi:hypothetical protein